MFWPYVIMLQPRCSPVAATLREFPSHLFVFAGEIFVVLNPLRPSPSLDLTPPSPPLTPRPLRAPAYLGGSSQSSAIGPRMIERYAAAQQIYTTPRRRNNHFYVEGNKFKRGTDRISIVLELSSVIGKVCFEVPDGSRLGILIPE